MVHLKNNHLLLFTPLSPLSFISEFDALDWDKRSIADRIESAHGAENILALQLEHDVDVDGGADITVRHDGKAADNEVARFGAIQGAQNGFDIGKFHGRRVAGCRALGEVVATAPCGCWLKVDRALRAR